MRERLRRYRQHVGYAAILAVAIALFGADPVSGQPFAAQIQALLRRSNTWLGTQTFTNVTVTGTCAGCGGGGTVTTDNIVTTSTDAFVGQNTTAATAGVPVQMSPRLRFRGNAWDTAASQTIDFWSEVLPATAATPTGRWRLQFSRNGTAANDVFYVDTTGATVLANGTNVFRANTAGIAILNAALTLFWSGRSDLSSAADGQLLFRTNNQAAGVGLDFATDGTVKLRGRAQTAGTGNLDVGAKVTAYNNVSTAGWGVPSIVAQARTVAATNTGTASVATYTVGAADGTFEVGCNVLVTTSTTHSFSCDTTYTDEGNTARTMVIPIQGLGGNFATNGLITNALGVGPYESAVMTIRAKAATAITIRTSAGGTFTAVVYNIDGTIKQVG